MTGNDVKNKDVPAYFSEKRRIKALLKFLPQSPLDQRLKIKVKKCLIIAIGKSNVMFKIFSLDGHHLVLF